MDEESWNGTAGEVIDSSSNENHGTAQNDLNTVADGKIGKCGSFDGVDDYIEISDNDSLEPANITISMWVHPTQWDHSAHVALITKRSAYGNGFMFFQLSNGNLNMDWGGSGANRWDTGYLPPLNQWTKLDYTFDGVTGTLYVNGLYQNSADKGNSALVPSTGDLRIGMDSVALRYPFNGKIDEVQIYDRALSTEEIKDLYGGGCVTCLHMDEESWDGTTDEVIDNSSNENHGTAQNDLNTIADGKIGRCGSFDGVDDYVEISDNDSLEPANITISMWVYPAQWDHSAHVALITKRSAYGNGFMFFQLSNGNLNIDWGGSGANRWDTGYLPPLNQWTKLDYTFDGVTGTLYVNGIYQNSTDKGNSALVSSTGDLRIGMDSVALRYPFNGKIDEVQIYSKALSAEKIQNLYGGSTVANYTYNEENQLLTENDTTYDYDNNGNLVEKNDLSDENHGTAQNGLDTIAAGKIGRCGSFDGVDDYIEISDNDSLEPANITISMWVHPTQWDHSAHVALITKRSAYGNGFMFFQLSNGNLNMDWGGSGANRWDTGYLPPLNQWTKLDYTFDGVTGTLYVNGSYQNSTDKGNSALVPSTGDLRIGMDSVAQRYPFNGKIDEVQIYDRALSTEEIQDLYAEPGTPPLQGCAAYWHMDEESWNGTADEVIDSSKEGITTYAYDYENRLTKIVYADSSSSEYTYDGAGKRIKTVEKDSQGEVTKTTKFLYDGLNVIIERDVSDQTIATYIRGQSYGGGIGGIISKKTSAGTNYYHYDGIGSVTGLTDVNEVVMQTYAYDAYGNLLSSTGSTDNSYQFSTKELSSKSGLVYFGARYYDPRVGRFITKDPLGMIDGPNMYLYVRNNPVNLVDPLGLCEKDSTNWETYAPVDEVARIVDEAIFKTSTWEWLTGKAGYNVDQNRRYIYTKKLHWIDLQHVVSAAHAPFAAQYIPATVGGLAIEVNQLIHDPQSAFKAEDIISNVLGGVAARKAKQKGVSIGEMVATIIRNAEPHSPPGK